MAPTIKSYRYCRIHFTPPPAFTPPGQPPSILGHKKSRPAAGMCENLAKYGLWGYAHLSLNCINLKHLCSQRCLYLILSNDSRDFEHPCVQKQIGNCKRHNYPFMRKNIKKEIPRCIAKCKLHTLKESFLSFNLI